jgi:biopolymer transport protein ExbD
LIPKKDGLVVINIVSAAQDERDPSKASALTAATAKEYRVGKEVIAAGDIDGLIKRLEERVRGKTPEQKAKVIIEIRSDYRVCFAAVRPAMVAAAEAGFRKMNITAKVQMME